MTREEALIWCSGFFDGEGCIGAYPTGANFWNLQVSIGQRIKEPMILFVNTLDVAIDGLHQRQQHDLWQITYYAANAGLVLQQLLPWLVAKREQAVLALEMRAIQEAHQKYSPWPAAEREKVNQIAAELKRLKTPWKDIDG